MRLGFYYHIPAKIAGEKILLPGYLGRFLDELADHVDQLILFLHEPNIGENVNFDYSLQAANIDLVLLPQRRSAPYRMLNARKFSKLLKQHKQDLDALMLRGPSPLLPYLARSIEPIPSILMIVGDYLAGIDSLPQPGWRKMLIRLMDKFNYHQQLMVAGKSLVFVNSKILFEQYEGHVKELFETRTTTLTKEDFFVRADTCQNHPLHLLYTGRMDPAKGLLDMVKALALLVQQGENVVLDLVGWSENNSNIIDQISSTAKQEGVEDRVFYHGYKSVGPDLFAYYKMADIYLIASQASEGFPRTIWEAMAHCLPVVATRVGSIPDFIHGAAELVDPKNPIALAAGIERIIDDPVLRKEIIKSGFQLAVQNTLEVQVSEMAGVIKAWVAEQYE